MDSSLLYIVVETSVFSGLPAVLIGLYNKSFNTAIIRWAFFYVLGSLIIDVSSEFMSSVLYLRNTVFVNSWPIFKIFTVTAFFRTLMNKEWKLKSLMFAMFVLVLSLIEGFSSSFGAASKTVSSIICIGLAFQYFYHLYKSETEIFIEDSVTFWIACAFFFNGTGSFFSYLLSEQILTDKTTIGGWVVFVTINIATNFIIAFALWKAPKTITK
ncbi:hypothetical protein [Roseivirga pacifica]|uniref:hypothetical protein n=1 Tax=Roseivirga pacifica TaxID=1267423 RepID=UPI002095316D|nr:hypothetical protein [Roseivirga pacifica]MCO6360537.1 hypothetical protein [Roseivirga pacifica]MCO6368426.1 hypothetical protein [Roseivirga pacifica]MCO6372568.1 hypothetical protein [Roseivirga pacifica]MCO6376626.1 hypothetical protein [Roseivirga pacifica]MCO6378094.1 hypothetical protein [Roseivirga pacifica]